MLFCEHEGTLTSSVSLCIGLWGRHREGGTRDLGQKRRSRQQSISHLQGRHTQWVRQCEVKFCLGCIWKVLVDCVWKRT